MFQIKTVFFAQKYLPIKKSAFQEIFQTCKSLFQFYLCQQNFFQKINVKAKRLVLSNK